VKYAERRGEVRNTHKILVSNAEGGQNQLDDVGANGKGRGY
jgi:hypothetical protein